MKNPEPSPNGEPPPRTMAAQAQLAQTVQWATLLNGILINTTHSAFPIEEKRVIAEQLRNVVNILEAQTQGPS